ncbi:hypothetical protein BAY1663_01768 [Pseudomonas sp. BAY1663]|uniref:hypothetical protein n=1 Tax=Pseudomonas sp. BAY1663 TaxID=1439940 RepID=UPI00042E0207|nr:hypothetical protein [Pseudomonas sp. BAY1663]EXF45831.1 hypothetical protein BAY1663_01768 [Pseudomonas sp. BAY1663]
MAPITLRPWTDGEQLDRDFFPVYCLEGNEEKLITNLQNMDWYPQAFSVRGNAEEHLEFSDLVLSCTLSHETPYPHLANPRNQLATAILPSCTELLVGLKRLDSNLIHRSCERILQNIADLNPKVVPRDFVRTIKFIEEFCCECLKTLDSNSPYAHGNNNSDFKSWWIREPFIIRKLNETKKKLKTEFEETPPGLLKIQQWIDRFISRLSRLHATPPTPDNVSKSILESSAYVTAIAERQIIDGNAAHAILLIHRAADLMLFSICVRNNIITVAQYGGKYTSGYEPQGKNTVTLMHSLSCLKNTISDLPKYSSTFDELNQWRNLLMQTHYMSNLFEDNAMQLFKNTRARLLKLGGPEWSASFKTYLEGIDIHMPDILDPCQKLLINLRQI